MAKSKVPVVNVERKNRLREMLSSRNIVERDNGPMMQASNKARMKRSRKG